MNEPIMGKNVVVGNNVKFGENVSIGHNVIIYDGTVIGNDVVIHDNVVIGKQPMRAKNSALKELRLEPQAEIGNGCTIGTNSIVYANAKLANGVFVADLATIRERVQIGENTIVGRGVAIENDCTIGYKCKLETNSYITAYSELGNNVFVAPGVVTTNDNSMARGKDRFSKFKGVIVKDGGRIGANVTVLPGKMIEEDGAVGAGSVVTKDVEKRAIVVGNPAKKFREVPEEQLLKNQ